MYRSCDVLVIPSDYEPWALVVNEAAAAGLAIVASNVVGAAAELVARWRQWLLLPGGGSCSVGRPTSATTDAGAIEGLKRGSAVVLAD